MSTWFNTVERERGVPLTPLRLEYRVYSSPRHTVDSARAGAVSAHRREMQTGHSGQKSTLTNLHNPLNEYIATGAGSGGMTGSGQYTVKYQGELLEGSGTLEIVISYVENHPALQNENRKKWFDADYHPSVGGGVNQRTKCMYLLLPYMCRSSTFK